MEQRTKTLASCRLYGIVDRGYVQDVETATCALVRGGVRIIQLRAKGLPLEEVKRDAQRMIPLCREAGTLFVLNDYPELAVELGADAVHVGQDAGPLAAVRNTVGPGILIGRSTHSLEQVRTACAEGADYMGFGPLYPTGTKPGRPAIGLHDLRAAQETAGETPLFCIGGINGETLPQVIAAGARRVVIVSWLLQQQDIAAAAQRVRAQLENPA